MGDCPNPICNIRQMNVIESSMLTLQKLIYLLTELKGVFECAFRKLLCDIIQTCVSNADL